MAGVQGTLTGVVQGATGTFSTTPLDPNGNVVTLPAGIVPVWTSSDPVNAPVTASADGLSATVAVPVDAPVGTTVTLSVSATLTDGAVPTSGPVSLPIIAEVPPPVVVASFIITQIS